jgi:hypothetical protein
VCAEAEITTIVADSAPAVAPVYLSATPQSFQRWANSHPRQAAEEAAEATAEEEEEEEEGKEEGRKVSLR